MKILEVKNLTFTRNNTSILKDFSLDVEKGERLCLLGESGCGKTTLLRLCAGLEACESGEIYLRSILVNDSNNFVKPGDRKVGYVFQNYALFEKINIRKNIEYGCKNEEDLIEAKKLIELLNLMDHLEKYPHELSGGEKQKVALARSLALKPDLLFLDEPFSSIDPDQTKYLINEMKELFSQLNVTVVMVTHSIDEANQFATRTIKMS